MKITELKDFKGDSSVSIRKGKKIVSYDYQIMLMWEINMVDTEGKEYAKTKGSFEFPELSNEEEENWEIRVQMGHDTDGI